MPTNSIGSNRRHIQSFRVELFVSSMPINIWFCVWIVNIIFCLCPLYQCRRATCAHLATYLRKPLISRLWFDKSQHLHKMPLSLSFNVVVTYHTENTHHIHHCNKICWFICRVNCLCHENQTRHNQFYAKYLVGPINSINFSCWMVIKHFIIAFGCINANRDNTRSRIYQRKGRHLPTSSWLA